MSISSRQSGHSASSCATTFGDKWRSFSGEQRDSRLRRRSNTRPARRREHGTLTGWRRRRNGELAPEAASAGVPWRTCQRRQRCGKEFWSPQWQIGGGCWLREEWWRESVDELCRGGLYGGGTLPGSAKVPCSACQAPVYGRGTNRRKHLGGLPQAQWAETTTLH